MVLTNPLSGIWPNEPPPGPGLAFAVEKLWPSDPPCHARERPVAPAGRFGMFLSSLFKPTEYLAYPGVKGNCFSPKPQFAAYTT